MKIKRWHVAVLALFVLLCGALFYHFYTERISNEALQAVDFQALRAHTAELLENGFRANDQLFSSDYYDVRPDSTCYIWLNGSENDADTPVSVATGYLNIRKSSPDAENKWMLRVNLWQEGGARVRMERLDMRGMLILIAFLLLVVQTLHSMERGLTAVGDAATLVWKRLPRKSKAEENY